MVRRLVVAVLAFACALLSGTAPASSAAVSLDAPANAPEFSDVSVAVIRPLEVRTRKLHVVRPDLLRFPMQYDTYC